MSVSTRTRFEVFKRDNFTCQYCGQTPPNVTLECDHIVPRCEGGEDKKTNLVTACFQCNRGKASIPLDNVAEPLSDVMEREQELEGQMKRYTSWLKKKSKRKRVELEEVSDCYIDAIGKNPDELLAPETLRDRFEYFYERMPVEKMKEAARIAGKFALSNGKNGWATQKYFCATCWNMIKGKTPRGRR